MLHCMHTHTHTADPSVFITPTVFNILDGDTVSIEAGVFASSANNTVEWFLNGLKLNIDTDPHLSQTVENSLYTLIITDINRQRLGEYTVVVTLGSDGSSASDSVNVMYSCECHVINSCSYSNKYKSFLNPYSMLQMCSYVPAVLRIYFSPPAPPNVSVSTSQINVNESDEVRVHCQGEGVGITVQWLLDGNDLPSGVTQDGTDLYISSVHRDHTGVYECRVSNIAGTVNDSVSITVNCKLIMYVLYGIMYIAYYWSPLVL